MFINFVDNLDGSMVAGRKSLRFLVRVPHDKNGFVLSEMGKTLRGAVGETRNLLLDVVSSRYLLDIPGEMLTKPLVIRC